MPYKPKLYTDDELYDILMNSDNSDFENIEAEHSIANNRSYNDSGSELSDLDENENNDENYDYESESADSSEDENNSATESSNTEITQFPEVGISGSIVLTLLEKYLNSGHSLYVDNWYTSPSLFSILHEKKTNACGTVKMNRKHMPPLQEKLKRGEYVCNSTKNILATKWQDKREVRMLSTMHTDEMIICGKTLQGEDKQKPSCILNYNENMGAIDKTDMLLSSTESVRKTIKWYKKVFLHLLDLSVLNAHVIYKVKTGDHMPLLKFQMKLVKELVDKYQMVRPRTSSSKIVGEAVPMRLVARHFPSHVEKNQNNKVVAKRCVVCRRHKIRKEPHSDVPSAMCHFAL
ncbi:hypothetical protein JTB14_024121 [Gonioctena quinquepunctata]|nr:hypothetical protein JTB14_024121 [Gonioctena quinquepunctata]